MSVMTLEPAVQEALLERMTKQMTRAGAARYMGEFTMKHVALYLLDLGWTNPAVTRTIENEEA